MLGWRNDQVLLWLRNTGQDNTVLQAFRDHNITGMTLPMLNSQELKEMGIVNLKQRLQLMESINTLIIEKNMHLNLSNLNNEHPLLSELQTTIISTALIKNISKGIVDETSSQLLKKSEALHDMEEKKSRDRDYHSLVSKINKLREEVLPILKDRQDNKPLPSPIPAETISPQRVSRKPSSSAIPLATPRTPTAPEPSGDTLKQLRTKTEDPCYKILQAAMRSHKLDKSEWRKYVLVICYGGDKERVLKYDEKPVVVFKELNELGLSPSIMLRQVAEMDVTGNSEDYETPGGRL